MKNIIFLGGDKRMIYAAEKLTGTYNCRMWGLGGNNYDIKSGELAFDCAVLPVQKSPDGITIPAPLAENVPPADYYSLSKIMKTGGTVLTGNTCPVLEQICCGSSLTLINYLEREELAVANAVPTAEGALAIAINALPVTIFGSSVLVTGFGRIAKILVKYLKTLGARVTVACRKKSDLKWAEISGCSTVNITDKAALREALADMTLIFNTVPSEVFGKAEIAAMKKNTLYLELASASGIDDAEAQRKGIEIFPAQGLPGKCAPITAGRIIAEAIINILAERSDTVAT